ncbi:hypothetical protein BS47DRAFT_1361519 [Hydnum rufescens UP504]|uniref:Uncharacterized protein n=1 Tax=Hydnum rufescens UP504 TaxID=1448309 RepID=A0A9P6AZD4_9AGAM|nr:hypothetical protein BS47DRAFT_1361519 [Hydnum rufescens UP504]
MSHFTFTSACLIIKGNYGSGTLCPMEGSQEEDLIVSVKTVMNLNQHLHEPGQNPDNKQKYNQQGYCLNQNLPNEHMSNEPLPNDNLLNGQLLNEHLPNKHPPNEPPPNDNMLNRHPPGERSPQPHTCCGRVLPEPPPTKQRVAK